MVLKGDGANLALREFFIGIRFSHVAVAHKHFRELSLQGLSEGRTVVYDVKGILPVHCSDERL